jgi:hypothetical protein
MQTQQYKDYMRSDEWEVKKQERGCIEKCRELIQSAKAFIGAFIEQAMLGGKISPPSGIFLMKNWLSYKDAISIEESIPNKAYSDCCGTA